VVVTKAIKKAASEQRAGVRGRASRAADRRHSTTVAAAPGEDAAVFPSTRVKPAGAARSKKPSAERPANRTASRLVFEVSEFVVYPAHGVGEIVGVEVEQILGLELEFFVILFSKNKLTLKLPISKATGSGLRKLVGIEIVEEAFEILSGRAEGKRGRWARRAQEYLEKINTGGLIASAEVVRDLYGCQLRPEPRRGEHEIYEAARDRFVREISIVQNSSETEALAAIEARLEKRRGRGRREGTTSGSKVASEEHLEAREIR
jgi:CarD family transcriptional regulator